MNLRLHEHHRGLSKALCWINETGGIMKFIVKRHFTFADLESRWECGSVDLIQAVIDGDLIPSIHLDGKYEHKIIAADQNTEPRLQLGSVLNGDDPTPKGRIGFHYLIWPRRTGSVSCMFSYASEQAVGHDEGDVCYELPSPLNMDHVLKSCIFMADEVVRVERASDENPAVKEREKPLGTSERNTLLTIIAALAKQAGIDVSKYGKSALSIAGWTDEIGAGVSKRAIEEHLKKIPDALEVRMK